MNNFKYPHKIIWKYAFKIVAIGILLPVFCINAFYIFLYYLFGMGEDIVMMLIGMISVPLVFGIVCVKMSNKIR